jgi:hypothetical protein
MHRHVYAHIFLAWRSGRFVSPIDSELSLVKRLKEKLNAQKRTLQVPKD